MPLPAATAFTLNRLALPNRWLIPALAISLASCGTPATEDAKADPSLAEFADSFDPITLVDRVVRPLGADGGVVSAETTLSGVSGGQRFSSKFRFSDTFERTGGEWRAVHIQVTRIAE